MKLEQQVCSLELAKKLKELGIKQNGYFIWEWSPKDKNPQLKRNMDCLKQWNNKFNCSAFTVAELGEILPLKIFRNNNFYLLVIKRFKRGGKIDFSCGYEAGFIDGFRKFDITEANCRAKMLINLLENNLIN
jgi:hypothetical protein